MLTGSQRPGRPDGLALEKRSFDVLKRSELLFLLVRDYSESVQDDNKWTEALSAAKQ
jgi:hypothetical protein